MNEKTCPFTFDFFGGVDTIYLSVRLSILYVMHMRMKKLEKICLTIDEWLCSFRIVQLCLK